MDSLLSAPGSVDEFARRRFESAWQNGRPGPIEDYLPPADDPLYPSTLEELVHIELELAWKTWRPGGDSSGPRVEDYLTRFPVLNRPDALLRLVRQEYSVRQRYGDRPTVDEYRARFPALAPTGSAFLSDTGEMAAGGPPEPQAVPGYQVLGVLGRGGMGVVYQARQVGLNRLVALKWLRYADAGPEDLARFRTEAEAVAHLQHPNIVQVFEVGSAGGLPFLALEYVPGGSLDRLLAGAPQPPRLAARLVERLAGAVQYAHDSGIVHRDLKPANILLAPRPDPPRPDDLPWLPKLGDFGLAKRLEADSGQTQTGAVLGTPSYMAPEQAAGRKDVGPPADVWALGAILYECLTGRPPFKGEDRGVTFHQVLTDEPVPPSRLQSRTPRDLDTICLKCLEKDPKRRYGSAAELADDLGRFLRGEPVRARPVGTPERAWRWARRNPRDASLIAALFLVLTGALVAVSSLYALAEQRRKAAEGSEERARHDRDEADESSRQARAAVRESLSLAADDPAFRGDGMAPARKRLQETALRYFREFIARRGDDPALQAEVADAHERVGKITAVLGTQADAVAELERARDLFARLAEANPEDTTVQAGLARVMIELGRRHGITGKVDDAARLFHDARTIRQKLVDADPSSRDRRLDLEEVDLARGLVLLRAQRTTDGLATVRGCLDRLGPDRGSTLRAKKMEVTCLMAIGQALWARRELDEAERALKEAIARQEEVLKADPSPDIRQELARAHGMLGQVYAEKNDPDGHLACYRKATNLRETTADRNPTAPEYLVDLAISYGEIANALEARKDAAGALEYREKALGRARQATEADAGVTEAWRRYGNAHWELYLDRRRRKELDLARQHLDGAQAAWERLVALAPGVPAHRDLVAVCHVGRADMARDAREYEKARQSYLAGRRMFEDRLRGEPDSLSVRREINKIDANLAYICQETGDRDGLFRVTAQVLQSRRELAEKYPKRPDLQQDLARTRAGAGESAQEEVDAVLSPMLTADKSKAAADAARRRLAELEQADPGNPDVKKALTRLSGGP